MFGSRAVVIQLRRHVPLRSPARTGSQEHTVPLRGISLVVHAEFRQATSEQPQTASLTTPSPSGLCGSTISLAFKNPPSRSTSFRAASKTALDGATVPCLGTLTITSGLVCVFM